VQAVIDIGANQGLFTIAARKRFPSAAVHSYEPNPGIQREFSINCMQAGAEPFAKAVMQSAGHVSILECDSDLHTRTKIEPVGAIPAVSLSEAISRIGGIVDVLKLDCEGAEWSIFEDASAWQFVKALTMEYHLWARPGSKFSDIERILFGLGFVISYHNPITPEFGLLTAYRESSQSVDICFER
jgi:FkbM family methyltransferase